MPDLDRQPTEVPCLGPGCGRNIQAEFRELWNGSRELRCRRCGTRQKYDSSLASRARQRAGELERAQEKFREAVDAMLSDKVEVKAG